MAQWIEALESRRLMASGTGALPPVISGEATSFTPLAQLNRPYATVKQTVQINWGDGSKDTGWTESISSSRVEGDGYHRYTRPGVYLVRVTFYTASNQPIRTSRWIYVSRNSPGAMPFHASTGVRFERMLGRFAGF